MIDFDQQRWYDTLRKVLGASCAMCVADEDPEKLRRAYKKDSSVTAIPPCRDHRTLYDKLASTTGVIYPRL